MSTRTDVVFGLLEDEIKEAIYMTVQSPKNFAAVDVELSLGYEVENDSVINDVRKMLASKRKLTVSQISLHTCSQC